MKYLAFCRGYGETSFSDLFNSITIFTVFVIPRGKDEGITLTALGGQRLFRFLRTACGGSAFGRTDGGCVIAEPRYSGSEEGIGKGNICVSEPIFVCRSLSCVLVFLCALFLRSDYRGLVVLRVGKGSQQRFFGCRRERFTDFFHLFPRFKRWEGAGGKKGERRTDRKGRGRGDLLAELRQAVAAGGGGRKLCLLRPSKECLLSAFLCCALERAAESEEGDVTCESVPPDRFVSFSDRWRWCRRFLV